MANVHGRPLDPDGTVRAYVVTMAPQVAGQIVQLPVIDNQFVHKGDLLLVIDPTDYKIAVQLAEAAVEHAQVTAQNAMREAQRRQELTELAVTKEEKQTFESDAVADQANIRADGGEFEPGAGQPAANRDPLAGQRLCHQSFGAAWRLRDGRREIQISLVDADSFWVHGYFEETNLDRVHVDDPAKVKLMGYRRIIRGHVGSIARGINVPNAQPNGEGLAEVNPIFTWVRLAQRIPVRIHIDHVPEGVVLATGETATVEIQPRSKRGEPSAGFGSAYPVAKRLLVGDKAVDLPDNGRASGRRAAAAPVWPPTRSDASGRGFSVDREARIDLGDGLIDDRMAHAELRADHLHQPVGALDIGRAVEQGARRRGRPYPVAAPPAIRQMSTKSLGDAPIFSDTSHTHS